MELTKIKSSGSWGKAADDLNQNFSKVNNSVEQVKNATTRNKGYFSNSSGLVSMYPTASVNDIAYVDDGGTDYLIYQYNGSAWADTGKRGGEGVVELGNYYDKLDVDNKLKATDEKLSELGQEIRPLSVQTEILLSSFENKYINSLDYDSKDNKTYFDGIFIQKGRKIKVIVDGTAEWDLAWVYYNNNISGNRLIQPIVKGVTHEAVAPIDITQLGIAVYTLTSIGSVSMNLSVEGDINEIKEELTNIENSVDNIPKYANYFNLSRPIEIGWKGKETIVKIKKNTPLLIQYNFTELVGEGWVLYANDYTHQLARDTSLSGEVTVKEFDYDIEKLILYTSAEIEGQAEFYIYVLGTANIISDYIGSPVNKLTYSNTSGTEYKEFAKVDFKKGSRFSLKFDGTAEWDNAWVYYNGDIAKKRLIQPVKKGEIYNIENDKDEDFHSLGFCIYTLKTQGEVEISLLYKDSILLNKVEKVEDKIEELGDKIEELEGESNVVINSIYKDKIGICIGDSHAVRRDQWVKRVYEYIGATYDSEVSSFVVGNGNSVGTGYEDCVDAVFAQAYRAVEKHKQGKKIDLILLDNVHYILGDNNVKDIIPFKPSNVVSIGSFASGTSRENSWFTENFNSIISGITPTVGTLLKSSWNALKYVLTFDGTPIIGTTFTLIVDGNEYATNIESGDTIETFVARVGEWVFNEDKFVATVEGNKLYLSYIGLEDNPQTTISYNGNNSGITMSYTNETNTAYRYRYFDSYSLDAWNHIDKWVLKTGSFDLGGFKGAIEYLFENIPNVQIVLVSIPCYRLNKTDFKTDLGYDMTAFLNSSLYSQGRARTKMLSECANYYNLKWVDIEKLWGVNIINWFDYSPENDVHPNKNGYTRIADVIISELS